MEKQKIKKLTVYVLFFVVFLAYFILRLPNLRNSLYRGITAPSDLAQDYIAARQIRLGKTVYPSDFAQMNKELLQSFGSQLNPGIQFRNAHPPFAAILMYPFSFIGFQNAAVIYTLITIVGMLMVIFLLFKTENIPFYYAPLMVLFIAAWPPFQVNLYLGQISVLITLFVAAGWFFYKKGNQILAGIFIALAAMIKFYPGILIVYFLINKKYKAFIASLIGVGIIFVLTIVISKHDWIHFIIDVIPQDVQYWQTNMENLSINGFFSKLLLPMSSYNNTKQLAVLVSPFLRTTYVYVATGLLVLFVILNMKKYDNDLGFSLFLILAMLISPICWNYYFTLLLISFVVLIKELLKKNNTYEILLFVASLLLMSVDAFSSDFRKMIYMAHIYAFGPHSSYIDTLTFYSLQFYGLVILLLLNFHLITKHVKNDPEHNQPMNQ